MNDFHPKSLTEIAERVEAEDGLLSMPMWRVRDAYGAARLGVNVRARMSDALGSVGLEHYPRDLPADQMDEVRLVKRGSPVSKLMRAARKITSEGDQFLREAAAGEANRLLGEIRELLCD